MVKLRSAFGLKTAFAAAMLCVAAEGGDFQADRWGYGPLAGVNVSGAELGGPQDRGIMGWAIGGRLERSLGSFLRLSTDPMFIRTGAEWDPTGQAFEARGQFYRVEVPMFLKAQVSLFNVMGLYAFAGPSANILWDVSGQLDDGHHLDHKDANRGSVSGDVGAGTSFALAPRLDITADARYSHGLTDALKGTVGEVEEWRNRDVRVVLGLLLHGG